MARMRKKLGAVLVGAAALSLTLTACGGGGGADGKRRRLRRRRDRHQPTPPATSATGCGTPTSCRPTSSAPTSSTQANPNINVKITQYGWDDYWSKLTNGFVAGDAPDVFTDHLSKYPEFVSQEQLVPLDDTLTKDGFNVDQYQEGLADLWKGQDGKRYGLPKDFDTIAIFYNKKLIADAGVKEADLQNLHLEPPGRRHLREGDRPPDRGQERQARRRAGLRQDQGQGLRPGPRRRLGQRRRPDPVEHVHRLQQLAIHRQEPVGHPLQLRPPAVPGDHRAGSHR